MHFNIGGKNMSPRDYYYMNESYVYGLKKLEVESIVPYNIFYNSLYMEDGSDKKKSLMKIVKDFFKKLSISIATFVKKIKIHIQDKLNKMLTTSKLKKEIKDVSELQKAGVTEIKIVNVELLMDTYNDYTKNVSQYFNKIKSKKYDSISAFESDMKGFIQYTLDAKETLNRVKVTDRVITTKTYIWMLQNALDNKSDLGYALINFNKTVDLIMAECESMTKKMTIDDELAYKRVMSYMTIATRMSGMTQEVLSIADK